MPLDDLGGCPVQPFGLGCERMTIELRRCHGKVAEARAHVWMLLVMLVEDGLHDHSLEKPPNGARLRHRLGHHQTGRKRDHYGNGR